MNRLPLVALLATGIGVHAQPLRSLKEVPIPQPPRLRDYVRDVNALAVLGKALFWDMQVGSDGRTACATCHFHAGADHRVRNQVTDPNRPFPVNLLLEQVFFPFHWLSDPTNRGSEVLRDLSLRAGSAGVFRRKFAGVIPGQAAEIGEELLDRPEFSIDGVHVRRITVRNSPSVIDAVFQVRNFWDGRAARVFNGFTVSGSAPGVLASRDGALRREPVQLDNSSLASQAVGPAMDALEMSYEGRTWPNLGRKMLSLAPLAVQKVSSTDSLLGPIARADGRGLRDGVTYWSLIQAAFQPAYWESLQLVDESGEVLPGRLGVPNAAEFTQAEYNFSLFWGLALQAYQSTLISNDTRFDQFMEGAASALTPQEDEGRRFFQGAGRCATCHGGAEFTAASFTALTQGGRFGNAIRAFQRTGVRPVVEDSGAGAGTFKTSPLRNVELTGPYFHNGGQSNLEQVIEFYARGGDFPPNNNNIRPFNSSSAERAALAAFLKSLTDERVRYERAPFDHPELCVPDGHDEMRPGSLAPGGSAGFPRAAAERWIAVPAVGAGGAAVPLQTFEELLAGVGADGSRAHAMREACTAPLP